MAVVLPPLPRMLFWLGYVTEQALVVNVTGFGVCWSAAGRLRIEPAVVVTSSEVLTGRARRTIEQVVQEPGGAGCGCWWPGRGHHRTQRL